MGDTEGNRDWPTLGAYFETLEKSKTSVNVASYVGQGNIWRCVMGDTFDRPTPAQMAEMKGLVDWCFVRGTSTTNERSGLRRPAVCAGTQALERQMARLDHPGRAGLHLGDHRPTGAFAAVSGRAQRNSVIVVATGDIRRTPRDYWVRGAQLGQRSHRHRVESGQVSPHFPERRRPMSRATRVAVMVASSAIVLCMLSERVNAQSKDPWRFQVTPFAWLPGLTGPVGVRRLETDIDLSVHDVLKALQFAAMLNGEARKGPWVAGLDAIYVSLGDATTFLIRGDTGSVGATTTPMATEAESPTMKSYQKRPNCAMCFMSPHPWRANGVSRQRSRTRPT
jgi:hypothetical protein